MKRTITSLLRNSFWGLNLLLAVLLLPSCIEEASTRLESRTVIEGRIVLSRVDGLNDYSRVRVDIGRGEGGISPDEEGIFRFSDLEADLYTLVVTYAGGISQETGESAYERYETAVTAGEGSVTNLGEITLVLADRTPPLLSEIRLGDGSGYLRDPQGGLDVVAICSDDLTAPGLLRLTVTSDGAILYQDRYLAVVTVSVGSEQKEKEIRVVCTDQAGQPSEEMRATILHDFTPPTVGATLNGGGTPVSNNPNVTVHVTASDALSGVVGVAIMETDMPCSEALYTYPAEGDFGFTLRSEEGERSLYLCARDAAGNVTESAVATQNKILLDFLPPTFAAFTVNGGVDTFSRGATVPLEVSTYDADPDSYTLRLWGNLDGLPSNGALTFAWDQIPSALTLSRMNDRNVVYASIRDLAGNESSVLQATITTDDLPPIAGAPAISLNGGNPYSITPLVQVALQVAEASSMIVACDGVVDSEEWVPFSPGITCNLGGGDAVSRTVAALFRDAAGNVAYFDAANETPFTDSIIVDDVASANCFVQIGANNDPFTVKADVEVYFECDGAEQVFIGGQTSGDDTQSWRAYPGGRQSKDANLTGGEGENRVEVRFKDAAGNISSAVSDLITLDSVSPDDGGLTIVGQTVGAVKYVRDPVLTIQLSSGDSGSGLSEAKIYHQSPGVTRLPFNQTVTYNLPITEGIYTLCATFVDRAGNESETPVCDTVRLDTETLEAPELVSPSTGAHLSQNTVTFKWKSVDSYSPALYDFRLFNVTDNQETANQSGISFPLEATAFLDSDKLYAWSVIARDEAGHIGVWASDYSLAIDRTAPTVWIEHDIGAFTARRELSVRVQARDNFTVQSDIRLCLDGDILNPCTSAVPGDWPAYAYYNTITLTPGDGEKHITLRAADRAGNVMAPVPVFTFEDRDFLTLDETPPVRPPELTPSSWSGNSDKIWLHLTVPSIDEHLDGYEVLGGIYTEWTPLPVFVDTEGEWVGEISLIEVELLQDAGQEFQVRAVDKAGNHGPPSTSVSVMENSDSTLVSNVPWSGESFSCAMAGDRLYFGHGSKLLGYSLRMGGSAPTEIASWKHLTNDIDAAKNYVSFTYNRCDMWANDDYYQNSLYDSASGGVTTLCSCANTCYETMRTDGRTVAMCRSSSQIKLYEIATGLTATLNIPNLVSCHAYDLDSGRLVYLTTDSDSEMKGRMNLYEIGAGTFHGNPGAARSVLDGQAVSRGYWDLVRYQPSDRWMISIWRDRVAFSSAVFPAEDQPSSTGTDIYVMDLARHHSAEPTLVVERPGDQTGLKIWGDLLIYRRDWLNAAVVNLRTGTETSLSSRYCMDVFGDTAISDQHGSGYVIDGRRMGDEKEILFANTYGGRLVNDVMTIFGDNPPLYFDLSAGVLIGLAGETWNFYDGRTTNMAGLWGGEVARVDYAARTVWGSPGSPKTIRTLQGIIPSRAREGDGINVIAHDTLFDYLNTMRFGENTAYTARTASNASYELYYNDEKIRSGNYSLYAMWNRHILYSNHPSYNLGVQSCYVLENGDGSHSCSDSTVSNLDVLDVDAFGNTGIYTVDENGSSGSVHVFFMNEVDPAPSAPVQISEPYNTALLDPEYGSMVGVNGRFAAFQNGNGNLTLVNLATGDRLNHPAVRLHGNEGVSIGSKYIEVDRMLLSGHTYLETTPQAGCLPVHLYSFGNSAGFDNGYGGYADTQCWTTIDQPFGYGCPEALPEELACENWGILLDGWYYAAVEGLYTFGFRFDDHLSVKIDGNPFYARNINTFEQIDPKPIFLTEGWHRFEAQYKESLYGAYLHIYHIPPGEEEFAVVPSHLWGHE